jgi:hypothetical protein
MTNNVPYSYYVARYYLRKIVNKLNRFVQDEMHCKCEIKIFTMFNYIGIKYELYTPKYDYPLVSNNILIIDYRNLLIGRYISAHITYLPCTKEILLSMIESAKEELTKEDLYINDI